MLVSILLMLLDHRYHQTEKLRSALSVVAYPIQLLAETPGAIGRWMNQAFTTHDELQQSIARLHKENLVLMAEKQKMASLRAENERLRDLLGSAYKVGNRVLIAELSSVDLDPFRQQIIIDKGSRSGVYEGQAVLNAQAVMGQVIHVTPFNSTVLLITDVRHAIPVHLLRNGMRSIAMGTGSINRLELPYLPNNADIRKGDLLVTSGLGGKFPPGYPVARITEVKREPSKPFAKISAEPIARLDRIHEALLVWEIHLPDNPTHQAQSLNPAPEHNPEEPVAP